MSDEEEIRYVGSGLREVTTPTWAVERAREILWPWRELLGGDFPSAEFTVAAALVEARDQAGEYQTAGLDAARAEGIEEGLEKAARKMEGEGQPGYAIEIRALKATP